MTRPIPDANYAELIAEKVLLDDGIKTFPVDPFRIAENREITVKAAPPTQPGVSGLLLRSGSTFGILYATAIASVGFQRFSVAHELGHYFMPDHIDAVLGSKVMHESRSGASPDRYEIEADAFAAALLMPKGLFTSALRKANDGLAGIEYLAGLCQTSMLATANRYVDHSSIPVAVVVSVGGRVEYCKMSPAFKEFRGLDWPQRNTPIPKGSVTADMNGSVGRIAAAERDEMTGSLQDWFGGPYDLEITEEVKGLGTYGKTLTILTLDTFADEVEDEAPSRWPAPRFR
ncbi:ImmA/IrrE family metallo-endopeptidase [Rhodoferax sp. BAB1]|uniref:ImmA/IrrE family metallo-endopeptidase n=1 Tax=Rhodoferax sp. BAB1 TaxID=2741720 RepID=UPI001575666D|nr:ImmA/IrrE family metallo-endopeptidase [Rhodoferax sp. BAB1]QKO20909.1 ImmA/IrrE family metallo-endopeptidase [Rhodoferax sp. BAB1]